MTSQTESRWLPRLGVSVGSLAIASGIFWLLVHTRPKLEVGPTQQQVPSVQVMRAAAVEVQRQWRGFGTVHAMDSADVPARVMTTVIKMAPGIEPGVTVKKDQLLVMLDPADFNRQVEIAQNNLLEIQAQIKQLEVERKSAAALLILAHEDVALAEAELQRVQRIFKQAAGSSQDIDRAKRELITAKRNSVTQQQVTQMIDHRQAALLARQSAHESTLRQAREDVARCQIVSPLDGVVELLDVEMGEHVTSGKRVARVVSLQRIEAVLRFPAASRSDVQPGNQVTLIATNHMKRQWHAVVARVGPTDDANTRTVTVYVELVQDQTSAHVLSPGQFVEAIVTSGDSRLRWVVPERAVLGDRLSLVRGDRVVTRPVQVDFLVGREFARFGLSDDQWVVLRTALAPGELVIVNPSQSINEGQRVAPIIMSEDHAVEKNEAEQSD